MIYLETFKIFESKQELPSSGDWIRLTHMEDMYGVPDGTYGQVERIDDIGNIIVKWETGSSLSLIAEIDEFEIISNEKDLDFEYVKRNHDELQSKYNREIQAKKFKI